MESIGLIALSRASVLQRQMDIVANNIANVSTQGYKAQRVLFEVAEARPVPTQPLDFVIDRSTYSDLSAGAITTTGNQLDVALNGEGFLSVTLPDGKTAYTRNGAFTVSAEGSLVDMKGNLVQGEGGTELSIPPDTKDITIGFDGTITTDSAVIGKLQVSLFENAQTLEPYGDNYYITTAAATPNQGQTSVVQGAVEMSNVSAVREVGEMMQIVRTYQSVQKILESEHERIRNAISKIGRVS